MNEIGLNEELASHAEGADRATEWPAASWEALGRHGVLRRSIPRRFGGDDWSAVQQLMSNEALSASCLTTAFILSQREAAVRVVLKGPETLQERFLPRSAASADLLTVGLSQLTTSRQHGRPALIAESLGNGAYRLDGVIPWVTAADRAAILGGATLADGEQILFVIPPHRDGVIVEPPMTLTALAGSRTAQVRCEGLVIAPEDVVAGPKPGILGAIGGGGLETSCLALGLGRAALELLLPETKLRPEVAETVAVLDAELTVLRQQLHSAALATPANPEQTLSLRTAATLFALRATQATMMLLKGAGFVVPHPAQRFARQAMFFLVWSCPRPVADGVRAAVLEGAKH